MTSLDSVLAGRLSIKKQSHTNDWLYTSSASSTNFLILICPAGEFIFCQNKFSPSPEFEFGSLDRQAYMLPIESPLLISLELFLIYFHPIHKSFPLTKKILTFYSTTTSTMIQACNLIITFSVYIQVGSLGSRLLDKPNNF